MAFKGTLPIKLLVITLAFCNLSTAKPPREVDSTLPSCVFKSLYDNCFARANFSNGNYYEGEWKDDLPDGLGRLERPDGMVYTGRFVADYFEGLGSASWKNGEAYTGEWKKSERDGQGEQIYANGDSYVGGFVSDLREGIGDLESKTGVSYSGEWKDDKFDGEGRLQDVNGDIYEGSFSEGRKVGRGRLTTNGGQLVVGFWQDDVLHGPVTIANPNGEEIKGLFELGLPFGAFRVKDSRGNAVRVDCTGFETLEQCLIDSHESQPISEPSHDSLLSFEPRVTGSGFQLRTTQLLVTNEHLVSDCRDIRALFDGEWIPVKVRTRDANNDIAILRGPDFLKPSDGFDLSALDLELLQEVYVGGFPYGAMLSAGVKLSKGSVSSLSGKDNNFSIFQFDATVQIGSSGGPILDSRGGLLGVVVGIYDGKAFQPAGIKIRPKEDAASISSGLNFGIKNSILREILRSDGLALEYQEIDEPLSTSSLARLMSRSTYMIGCN